MKLLISLLVPFFSHSVFAIECMNPRIQGSSRALELSAMLDRESFDWPGIIMDFDADDQQKLEGLVITSDRKIYIHKKKGTVYKRFTYGSLSDIKKVVKATLLGECAGGPRVVVLLQIINLNLLDTVAFNQLLSIFFPLLLVQNTDSAL